jgi:glutaredoxin
MKIVAYTTQGCFYCDQLKELFKRANIKYESITIDEGARSSFNKQFPRATGYPYVVIDDKHVGGLVETATFLMEKGFVSAPSKK